MKKLITLGAFALFGAMQAQENSGATSKGKWVVETNAGTPMHLYGGGTGFLLTSADGDTIWNVGAEGGYFVSDNLAVKAGLGYGDYFGSGIFSYRVGLQYYINGKFPVAADFSGISADDDNLNWLGLEGGYAWFVASNVAITPKVRYNFTLDENKSASTFQGLIGFSLFF